MGEVRRRTAPVNVIVGPDGAPSRGPADDALMLAIVRETAERWVALGEYDGSPFGAKLFDFSPASIAVLDRLLTWARSHDRDVATGIREQFTAYLMETVRRAHGGGYARGDGVNPLILVMGEPEERHTIRAAEWINSCLDDTGAPSLERRYRNLLRETQWESSFATSVSTS